MCVCIKPLLHITNFLEQKLPEIFAFSENDVMGACKSLENQVGAKTNFTFKGNGVAIFLSAIPSNLDSQKAVDDYYGKYMNLPDVDVTVVENIGQGAVWLKKQRMLSFTQDDHTMTLICSAQFEDENNNKEMAIKIAASFLEYNMK